jgi:hypothetical protein
MIAMVGPPENIFCGIEGDAEVCLMDVDSFAAVHGGCRQAENYGGTTW